MTNRTLAKIGVRGSLADERAARRAEILRTRAAAYKVVDARDQGRCRVCGHRTSPTAVWVADKTQRHHMTSRKYAGSETSANIVTVCGACHRLIHDMGLLRVTGNADALGELLVMRRDGDDWFREEEFLLRDRPRGA